MRAGILACAALCAGAAAQNAPERPDVAPVVTPPAAQRADALSLSLGVERRRELAAAAARGLRHLARTQTGAGCWQADIGHKRMDSYLVFADGSVRAQEATGAGHVGVTSLAALAFLAGGHLPDRGAYGKTVRSALDHVLGCVQENGYITQGRSRMYSHAFATLFLAQVHGMVNEERVRNGLERAVRWVVDNQNGQGGWRYNPFTQEADMSVTVCQLQALRAARNIGIRVSAATIDRAVAYVDRGRTDGGYGDGLYFYKSAGRGSWSKNQQFAVNAAAVTSLFSAGVHDRTRIEPALAFLEREYPRLADYYRRHFYFWYGNYYACQAFFQAGGPQFDRYYRAVCDDLLADQQSDGRWINDVGPGDAFATAVACLILQLPQQYLPIFQR